MTLGSYGLIQADPDPFLVLHIFGVTLVAYNVQRLVRMEKFSNRTEQIRWYLQNKWMLYTALVLGLITAGITFLLLPFELLLRFAPLAVLSVLYSVPLLPSKGSKLAIRAIPGAKIFIIALVWTGVTLLLPMMAAGLELGVEESLQLIERFSYMLAITLPFDMRDIKYDDENMKTIPQLLGYDRSKDLALILLTIAIVLHLYTSFILVGNMPHWTLALPAFVYLLTAALIYRMKKDASDIFYTGVLDGTMLLLGLILIFV
jgi:hypothetical protein